MSDQYSKITVNQLDIEPIADYVIQSKKLVYRTGETETSSTNAMDVDAVAGVPSNTIAVAIDSEHRDTVNNTLHLDGHPASDFMTIASGNDIISVQDKITNSYGSDIKDVRDELYQLRNELVKNGYIKNLGQYEGFTDSFKRNSYINIQDRIGVANTLAATALNEIIVNDLDAYDMIDVYDFIVLYNTAQELFEIKQVSAKDGTRFAITLDSDIKESLRDENLEIYLSKGINDSGYYKFAKAEDTQIGSEEFHTGLSDDTFNVSKRLNTLRKGYGTSFRVPEAKQGYVTSFEICAKAYGSPGAIMCYLIDSRDLEKFKNPLQAEINYRTGLENQDPEAIRFFAKSQPYILDQTLGKRYINLNFLQDDGTYPLMPRDEVGVTVRYIAIIETLDVDASNYYDIVFLQHRSTGGTMEDLELNNITYNYSYQDENSEVQGLLTDDEINRYDMYYHITTRNVVDYEAEAQKQGLYTARYTFQNIKYGFGAAKARLMLRVKREGEWNIITNNDEPRVYASEAINLINSDENNAIRNVEDLRLKTEIYKRIETRENGAQISEQINTIMGNNITKIQGYDNTTVTTMNPVLLQDNDKIYRCGYLVSLKARELYFDNITGEYTVGAYDHFVLPLTDVYKDLDQTDLHLSDRLIFEADLKIDGVVKNYNDFVLQIFWENREMSSYADIKADQMGAIKDLVLSFDRGF